MPRYRVRAPDGRTVTLTGDTPPTDEDLDEIFAGLPPAPRQPTIPARTPAPVSPTPMAEPPGYAGRALREAGGMIGNIASGVAQEAPLTFGRLAMAPQNLLQRGAEALSERFLPEDSRLRQAIQQVGDQSRSIQGGFEDLYGQAPDASTEERIARGVTRAAPQVALGVATGGTSVPLQVGLAGASQGAQALSEGASPEEAAFQGALAAGGQGLGAAVGAAARPFARRVSQATVDAAERLGIRLPASAQTDSWLAQTVEGAASKAVGGGRIGQRAQQASEALRGQADEIIGAASPEAAGQGLARDYRAAREGLRQAKNEAYGRVGNLTGIEANPTQTLEQIDAILREGTAAPDVLARLRQLRAAIAPQEANIALRGGETLPAGLEDALRAQGVGAQPRSAADLISQQAGIEYGGPNALGDEALANRLRASLGQDVDAALAAGAPEQLAARNAAKDAYRQYAQLSNSSFGRRISTLADQGQWDKVASIVRSTESGPNVRRMVELMSPETLDEVRSNVMADIVGRATRGGNFTPQSLERSIRQWPTGRLREILTPEQAQRLEDISEVARALGKTTRITGGSQTAWLARILGYGGGAAINPPLALKALIGEAAFGTFIGSGAGQRWLTSGILPNAGRNVTAAGRLGASMAGGPQRDYARDVERARRARQAARP